MISIQFEVDDETAAFISRDAEKLEMSVQDYIGRVLHKGLKETREHPDAERRLDAAAPLKVEYAEHRRTLREELYGYGRLR